MKITKSKLQQIIQEELRHVLAEQDLPGGDDKWNDLYVKLYRKANSDVTQMKPEDWKQLNDLADKLSNEQKRSALSRNIGTTERDDNISDMETVAAMVPNMATIAKKFIGI